MSTLLAVIFGGWLAARLAGRFGLYQGIVVAIGFIAVGAIYTFFQESSTIASSLATNSHHLIDLGPMDLGNLFSGDLLALFGGSVGGLLSGKRYAERPAGAPRMPAARDQTPTAPACAG